MKPNWYVITGSASCGKTTLVNALAKMGYLTVPEVARTLIDKEIKKGKTIEEIRKDEADFQRKVLDIKINVEKNLPKDEIVFFDRGMPDSIAYYQICGLDIEKLLKLCKEKTYRKIFLLEQLPFEKDYARVEDIKTINKIQILLRKAYLDVGYEIVKVPAMPVDKRLEMILANTDFL